MVEELAAAKRERDEFYPDSPWVFSRGGKRIQDLGTIGPTPSRRLVYRTSTSTTSGERPSGSCEERASTNNQNAKFSATIMRVKATSNRECHLRQVLPRSG